MFQAVTASPHLVRYLHARDPVETLGTSANGNVVAAGTITGRLVWFDLATGVNQSEPTGLRAISEVAVNADGSVVVATDGQKIITWNAASGSSPHRIASTGSVSGLAVSTSGLYLAFVHSCSPSSSSSQCSVTLADVSTGRRANARVPSPLNKVTFTSRPSLVAFNGGGGWEEFRLPDLREISHGGRFLAPASSGYTEGNSPDGGFSAYITYGSVTSWKTTDTTHQLSANNLAPPPRPPHWRSVQTGSGPRWWWRAQYMSGNWKTHCRALITSQLERNLRQTVIRPISVSSVATTG